MDGSIPSSPRGHVTFVIVLGLWLQMSLIMEPGTVLVGLLQGSKRDTQGGI